MPATAMDILLIGEIREAADSLRMLGHRIFPAARSNALITMLAARPFDVVMVAGEPADGSAAALIACIRNAMDPRVALTPVLGIALTSATMPALVEAGADEVLAPPLTPTRLQTAFQALLPDAGQDDLEAMVGAVRLNDLLRMFATTLRDQVRLLRDGAELGAVAHRVKGAAANLGYAELSEVANEIMLNIERSPGIKNGDERELLRMRTEAVIVEVENRLASRGPIPIP